MVIAVAADSTEALLWWASGGACVAFAIFCVFAAAALRRDDRGVRTDLPPLVPVRAGGEESSLAGPNASRDDSPLQRIVKAYRRYQSWRRARERELGIRNGRLR